MEPIYSHPPEDGQDGVLLTDHLEDVAERVEYVIDDGARTPDGESLRAVVETLAHVHDFGKATTFFQHHLHGDSVDLDDERYRYHAPVGSFAAYYALDVRGFETETCLAGFVAVAKHHGRLPDVAEYVHERALRREKRDVPRDPERQQNAIQRQLKNINDNVPGLAETVFERATAGEGDWLSFAQGFLDLLDEVVSTVGTSDDAPGVDREALSADCYALVLQCWSALVLADKTSAAGARNDASTYAPRQPAASTLNEYINQLEEGADADPDGTRAERLNHYRSRARRAVRDNAQAFAEDGGGVATLTLPTGMGKTLTGLSAAVEIRNCLDGGRVVYALPFTSVIDQVVDELEAIYQTETTGGLLSADHHLAETVMFDDEDREADEADRSDDVAGMLGRSWRAGLTVSTFVQLFESLAGPGNQQSMKLPALRNSVVILDEPQSLPLDWWKLVPRLVELLTEQYGATVIAMTATQPKLFDDAQELVDDPDAYFEDIERVTYDLDESTERYIDSRDKAAARSYDDAAAEIRSAVQSDDSVLAVCNTVDSARRLMRSVADTHTELIDVADIYATVLDDSDVTSPETAVASRVKRDGRAAVLHLSTRLRPIDRLRLIEAAKKLTERGCALAVVSTQLVEAGVDISFDRVYRDLAPIDSIVQAAGRCNRSFERDRGRITVWWLDVPDDQEKTPAEAVYNRGTSLLPVAADALASTESEVGHLDERAVARTAVERYYARLHEVKDVGKERYADYVDRARADKLGKLSLIEQRRAVDIVVCRTSEDRERVRTVRDAADEYDFETFRQKLDRTKQIRLSVPVYREDSETADAIRQLPPLLTDQTFEHAAGIRVLDVREHGSHFDDTTGFVVPQSSVEHLFL